MSSRPRLVALDIDGTLVGPDERFADGVLDAVSDAVRAGARVVLATGRGWRATRHVFEELGLPPGPSVTSNGAVIVTYPPFHLDAVTTFDPREVVEQVAREHPRGLVAVEVVGQGYKVNRPFPEGELMGSIDVVGLDELARTPATRVVVRDPEASDEEFIAVAERLGLTGVSYYIGYSAWLDIAPAGVDKATGLLHACHRYHIDPSEVLAVGDGRNDVEMLMFAGRGVAMGESPEELLAIADDVTGTFDEGGLVAELRRWF